MNNDVIALFITTLVWIAWSFMKLSFESGELNEGISFPKKLVRALMSSWYVIVAMWVLYCHHMWSVYDHSPWPMSLIDKL